MTGASHRWRGGLILLLFGMGLASASDVAGQAFDTEAPDTMAELIDKATAAAEQAPQDAEDEQAVINAWVDVYYEAFDLWVAWLLERDVTEADVQQYWQAFGQHGAVADFLLFWTAEDMLSPNFFGPECRWDEQRLAGMSEMGQRVRNAQIHFAQVQARSFLENPDQLEAYVHMVSWLRIYTDNPLTWEAGLRSMREAIHSDDPERYWWGAREFLVLAALTGQDDWFAEADPEELGQQFDEWLDWFIRSIPRLAPSEQGLGWEKQDELVQEFPDEPAVPDEPQPEWPEDVQLPTFQLIQSVR